MSNAAHQPSSFLAMVSMPWSSRVVSHSGTRSYGISTTVSRQQTASQFVHCTLGSIACA